MASREALDQIARLGLFGKSYKDYESAPPQAQKVIRVIADSNPALPPGEAVQASRPDRPPQRLLSDGRLRKLEASVARIEKAVTQLTEGLARLEQLDVIASAVTFKMDKSRKIRAGVLKAKRQGKHCGRPFRDVPHEEVFRLQAEGLSPRKIALRLGIPHSTIVGILKRGSRAESRFDEAPN